MQGVPVKGIIDSSADITIINGDVFKKIAAVSRLKKKAFKAADKIPVGYDNRPSKLDGRLDLGIAFGDCTLHTTVYLKMDARDLLYYRQKVHVINWALFHIIPM